MNSEATEHSNGEALKGLDEREAAVVREARFYEPYKDDLHGLFLALDRADKWSEAPTNEDFLSYMRRGWIGMEHGNAANKDQFTSEQVAAAMPYLERLGLTTELLPPKGTQVDQTVVVGGTTLANYRRTELVGRAADLGIDVGNVICWYGQRPREGRDGTNEEILSTEGRFAGHDVTNNPWVKSHVLRALESNDPWAMTETHFGRVALNKVAGGNLMPSQINLPIVEINGQPTGLPPRMSDAPAREVLDYHFVTDRGLDVTLLNVAAANRGDRPSRHTTKSSSDEWLERYAPPQNATVMYVTGNPHSLRTAQDTYKILQQHGRGDIQLIVAGTAPAKGTSVQAYLGEVARLIDNDVKRNYQQR